jgi:hypothetical protein
MTVQASAFGVVGDEMAGGKSQFCHPAVYFYEHTIGLITLEGIILLSELQRNSPKLMSILSAVSAALVDTGTYIGLSETPALL